jgi:hypothetical protein
MKRIMLGLCAFCLVLSVLSITALADEIAVKVSPNAIVIESDGAWVTVHTDIALSAVDTSTLTLNGVEVAWTKADAKGNLVAKFTQADIKPIIAPPEATLELAGMTKAGVEFSGSDTVLVK